MQLRVGKTTWTTTLIQVKGLFNSLVCLQQWLQVDPREEENQNTHYK